MTVTEREIEIAPTIVDLPTARPSQILRSLAARRWCRGEIRQDGGERYCAIGRLADEGGFRWEEWDGKQDEHSNVAGFVRRSYGLKTNQIAAIMYRNDVEDLDVVIDFLERRGF